MTRIVALVALTFAVCAADLRAQMAYPFIGSGAGGRRTAGGFAAPSYGYRMAAPTYAPAYASPYSYGTPTYAPVYASPGLVTPTYAGPVISGYAPPIGYGPVYGGVAPGPIVIGSGRPMYYIR